MNTKIFSSFFDATNKNWNENPAYNRLFLQSHQAYSNDLLQHQKHLFLNEVYDMLGMPRTREGVVNGWLRDDDFQFVVTERDGRLVVVLTGAHDISNEI